MAQPFDPQNATNIYTKTNNESSEDFDDGFREGSGSGTSNNKRSVTHIFVSQHALAALAHGCKKPKFYIIFLEFIFWGRNELHFVKGLAAQSKAEAIGWNKISSANQRPGFQMIFYTCQSARHMIMQLWFAV